MGWPFGVRGRPRGRVVLDSGPLLPDLTERFVLAASLIVVAAYLIGSVSFAVVVSKAFGLPDPHEYGSGNPGATNVLRTGNKAAALLTLVGDGVKGFVVVLATRALAPFVDAPDWIVPVAAVAAFLGHLYPIYHHFSGGKGVATAAGIVFALNWPLALGLTAIWLTLAFGFKISSVAALITATLLPLGMFYLFGNSLVSWAMLMIAALIFWRHRTNIRQLFAGKERVIGD